MIKNREKLLTFAAIGIIVLLGCDRFVFTPLIKSWQDRADRIKTLTTKNAEGIQLLKVEKSIRDRWNMMRTNSLPQDVSEAESKVLKAVDRWAQTSRVSVASLKPQWKNGDDDYKTFECRADVTGNMQAVARFMYEMEIDPLALKIEEIELTTRDNDGKIMTLGARFTGLHLQEEKK